jgi:hypothetical protein
MAVQNSNFTTLITAIDTKAQSLAASATDAKDLVFLGKTLEALNVSATVSDIIAAGDQKVAAVAAQGVTSVNLVTAAQTSATTAINAIAFNTGTVTAVDKTLANSEHVIVTAAGKTMTLPEGTAGGSKVTISTNGTFSNTVVTPHGAAISTTKVVTVVNSGGNKFALDGVVAPVLNLYELSTYIFDVSHSSNAGHPLVFRNADDSAYTTGVTVSGTAGSSGATVTLVVAANAPALKYSCSVHGNGMGNSIATPVGQKIMSQADNESLTIDRANAFVRFQYHSDAHGWRIS